MEKYAQEIEDLEKVRTLIRKGWCQGRMTNEVAGKTQYCLTTAFSKVRRNSDAAVWFQNGIGKVPPLPCSMMLWNDQYSLPKSEVLKRFEDIIHELQAERNRRRRQSTVEGESFRQKVEALHGNGRKDL